MKKSEEIAKATEELRAKARVMPDEILSLLGQAHNVALQVVIEEMNRRMGMEGQVSIFAMLTTPDGAEKSLAADILN